MSALVTWARFCQAAWATAVRAVTMSARSPSTSKAAQISAIFSSAGSLSRTVPILSRADSIRAVRAASSVPKRAAKPAGSAS